MIWRAALLLAAAGAWGEAQDTTTTPSGALPAVKPVRGDLLHWRSGEGKTAPLSKETRVAPADRLGTKDGDYATLTTESGTIVSLRGVRTGAERGLGIERREGKLVFRVFEGKLAVQTFEEGVKVETPAGQLSAGQSHFIVEVEKEKVRIIPVDGTVTFTNSLGSVVVEPGRETVAEPGKKPSPSKATDVGKATEEFNRLEAAFNLIKNPGFEDGLKEWGPAHFTLAGKRHTELDTTVSHSGRASVRLDISPRTQGRPGMYRFAVQDVAAVPGKTYLFRFYLRGEIREGKVTARIGLGGVESPDAWNVTGEKAWRPKSVFVTAKDKALQVMLEVTIESDQYSGSLWLDDFLLSEFPK
jgi:hypothetical protein